jgi:ATPase subunit of ABC transporter with duplicated ATPase domains
MRKELAWLRRGPPARTSKPQFRIDAANALIADEPPLRNPVELARMATARLGRDVVDLLDVSVSYGDTDVLRDVTWLVGPGERTGILGVNGAGKSTLLGLVTGVVRPTTGRVKRGKTVKVATLTQQLAELDDLSRDRVSDVVARYRTTYATGGKEMTPGQLLERLGFTNAQLATPVGDLSGGQRRRLQLLLTLLDEPNVLVLDEPTNDMDTDMLAALEDLLDSWPGTLLVVSHDRYLLERVTDQQYALLGGHLRHVPGGVDEYLRLLERAQSAPSVRPAASGADDRARPPAAADQRAARKELGAVERRLAKVTDQVAAVERAMVEHDPTDHVGLITLSGRLDVLNVEVAELEERWMVLAEDVD